MNEITSPTLSLVLPVYREGKHLAGVLTAIQAQLDATGETYELVIVDDGSPDNSWDVIASFAGREPRARGLRLSRNFGKESALCAGIEAARGSAIIIMDADLQHPPELIPEMVRRWRSDGINIAEGVKREIEHESFPVRVRRRVFYHLMKKFSGFDLDSASDFKLIDSRVRSAWLTMGERNLFFRGMIAWLGFKRVQIPFVVPARIGGSSRWDLLHLTGLAITSLTAFSNIPVRFASLIGVVFFLFAIVLGVYAVIVKLQGNAVGGFTTVILLQLIIGSGIFFAVGVLGEYIGRIYEETKKRPRYIVAETTTPGVKPGD